MVFFITILTLQDVSLIHKYLEQYYQDNAGYVALLTCQNGAGEASISLYVGASWQVIRDELMNVLPDMYPPVNLVVAYGDADQIKYLKGDNSE